MADPASAVSAADKNYSETNVVDNVNDHTPNPETPPVANDVPTPTPQEAVPVAGQAAGKVGDGVAEIQKALTDLTSVVESLAATVLRNSDTPVATPPAIIGQAGDAVQDAADAENDGRVPWTHRGGK